MKESRQEPSSYDVSFLLSAATVTAARKCKPGARALFLKVKFLCLFIEDYSTSDGRTRGRFDDRFNNFLFFFTRITQNAKKEEEEDASDNLLLPRRI